MRHPLPASSAGQPLVVRLRNWVGDVVLGVPSLRLLQAQGYRLHLLGKPWAQGLLRGEGWAVEPLAATWRGRVAQLRQLRRRCREQDRGFDDRVNALVLPFSFSSAIETRLAGLRGLGYAHEGRSWLLGDAPRREDGLHELESYWRLAARLLPQGAERPAPPRAIGLNVAPQDQSAAGALALAHRIQPGYVVLCPYAGGTFDKQPKTWPHFPALARALLRQGRQVVLCPGPGDAQEESPGSYDGCLVLRGVALGVYAALLKDAALMVSNDTGPGHLAAAVGTPTVSVLGPTVASQWGAWGPCVRYAQGPDGQWPTLDEVLATAEPLLPASTERIHE